MGIGEAGGVGGTCEMWRMRGSRRNACCLLPATCRMPINSGHLPCPPTYCSAELSLVPRASSKAAAATTTTPTLAKMSGGKKLSNGCKMSAKTFSGLFTKLPFCFCLCFIFFFTFFLSRFLPVFSPMCWAQIRHLLSAI